MPTLVIHAPDSRPLRAWLDPGVYTVGRGADNPIAVDHSSLGEVHCELEVREDGSLRVRDRGSSEGTWVGDRPVDDGEARPGEVIRAGEVRLWTEMLAAEEPGAAVETAPIELVTVAPPPPSFFAAVPGAFVYALQGEFLVFVMVVVLGQSLLHLLPWPIQYLAWVVDLVLAMYVITLWRDIVLSTAEGHHRIPALNRSFLDWEDTKQLALHFFLLGLLCFGPSSVSLWWVGERGGLPMGLFGLGCLYFPAALYGILVTDDIRAVNPVTVFNFLRQAPLPSLFLSLTLAVGLGLPAYVDPAWIEGGPSGGRGVPVVRVLVGAVISGFVLYLSLVWMRWLGLLHRVQETEGEEAAVGA